MTSKRALYARGSLALACTASLAASAAAEQPPPTVREIVRLTPARWSLPAAFVRELLADGCTIPQPLSDQQAGRIANVISGSFARRGQKDYAVLCSLHGISHIRVYWGGRARCPSRIEYKDDLSELDEIEPGVLGYGRAIDPAPQATIAYFQRELGGPAPPDRAHAGIDDVQMGKASIIWYCAAGSWAQLQGMD